MNRLFTPKAMSVALIGYLCTTGALASLPELKPTGISVDLFRHTLDFKVTDIDAHLPGVTPEVLNAAKPTFGITNDTDAYGLRLDYQLHPSLNIFGELSKAEQTTHADFSSISPLLSNIELDQKGMAYSVGAHYLTHLNPVFLSMSMVHSRIDLDDNPHDIKALSIVPSVGTMTPIGVVTGSLLYQDIDMRFAGNVDIPGLGSLPVDISAKNKSGAQALVGLKTRLAKDLYLDAQANLNKHDFYQLQINQRF